MAEDVPPHRGESMMVPIDVKVEDGVVFAERGAGALAASRKDCGDFLGDAVLLCDVEVAHQFPRYQAENHNYKQNSTDYSQHQSLSPRRLGRSEMSIFV